MNNHKENKNAQENIVPSGTEPKKGMKISFPKPSKKLVRTLLVIAVVLGLIGAVSMLVRKNLGMLIAARVDNSLITRAELNKALVSTYGTAVLEDLINKKLISAKIKSEGVIVKDSELSDKTAEIEKQILDGTGLGLDAYLEGQSLSRADFDESVKTQIALEKIFSKDIDVTEEALEEFLTQNSEYLQGETEEAKREEAIDALINRELGTRYQTWLEEARSASKIVKYLQ